jgi:maltose O-acetyltransferase
MLAGQLCDANDPALQADRAAAEAWIQCYNAALACPLAARQLLLQERLAEVGDGAVVGPPFYCDYRYKIRLGPGAFLNFNWVILDVVAVTIGAGSVDTRDVPAGATALGNPARIRA